MPRSVADQMQDPTPMDGAETVEAALAPQVVAAGNLARQSLLDRMRAHFAQEKRVRVKVHNDGPVTVQVNGYTFHIRENVAVEVPESVATLLDQAGYI